MGRTPGNLDQMFAAADQNGKKLTKAIFDAHRGADMMTFGNAQRRYKTHCKTSTSGYSSSGAGGSADVAQQPTQTPKKDLMVPDDVHLRRLETMASAAEAHRHDGCD